MCVCVSVQIVHISNDIVYAFSKRFRVWSKNSAARTPERSRIVSHLLQKFNFSADLADYQKAKQNNFFPLRTHTHTHTHLLCIAMHVLCAYVTFVSTFSDFRWNANVSNVAKTKLDSMYSMTKTFFLANKSKMCCCIHLRAQKFCIYTRACLVSVVWVTINFRKVSQEVATLSKFPSNAANQF